MAERKVCSLDKEIDPQHKTVAQTQALYNHGCSKNHLYDSRRAATEWSMTFLEK